MKATVLDRPYEINLKDVPEPAADEEFLTVKVEACGICGSDIRYYEGENPWALHTLGKNLPNPPGIILGHEFAGVVEKVHNPYYRELLGKRVAVMAFKSCGVCDNCRSGNYNLCEQTMHLGHGAGWGEMEYYPGGMAEYCQVWNTHVCVLPDSVSFEEATLLDPISVAIHAISLSGIKPGEDVLVLGTGAVGLSITQAVRAYGANKVICTDCYDGVLAMAEELGADKAVNARERSVEEALIELGLTGVPRVFDTVGERETQKLALKVLKESGTLVNLVANQNRSDYRLMDLYGEKRMITSANNKAEDFLLGMKLVENGTIQAGKMITHRFSLDEVQKGFDVMRSKDEQTVMKVVITP